MSQTELSFKTEEADIGIKQQETEEECIENKEIIDFLMQHEPRKDIDFSKIKIPSYLYIDDEEDESNEKYKD